jgi:hypothetical protein
MNRDWFNLKNKLSQNNSTFSNHGSDGIHNGRNLESNIVAFMETSMTVGYVIAEPVDTNVDLWKNQSISRTSKKNQ